MNIKDTKIMTTEEIHNFNIKNENKEIVKDFAHLRSAINLNGDCSQETKRRPRRIRKGRQEQRYVIAN